MVGVPSPGSREAQRSLLARHLAGQGVELGPGHVPFPIPYPGVEVRYVDRWQPEENRALFEELGEDAGFPAPDIISNFDTDRLTALADCSQDFVIASHVLEHVANPVALLADTHRVLRPGGTLLLLLPDRRRTFDRSRAPTTLDHLLDEHSRNVDHVDDEHVLDFLVGTDVPVPDDPHDRAEIFEFHRRRSIHVHCWQEEEFFEVLVHAVTALGQLWELVDCVLAEDEGEDGFEFGYVLRRSTALDDAGVLAERLRLAWGRWYEHRVWLHGHVFVVRSLRTEEVTTDRETPQAPAHAAVIACTPEEPDPPQPPSSSMRELVGRIQVFDSIRLPRALSAVGRWMKPPRRLRPPLASSASATRSDQEPPTIRGTD